VKKDSLRLDLWAKDLAPSPSLRQWFGHDPDRFHEFARRYHAELRAAQLVETPCDQLLQGRRWMPLPAQATPAGSRSGSNRSASSRSLMSICPPRYCDGLLAARRLRRRTAVRIAARSAMTALLLASPAMARASVPQVGAPAGAEAAGEAKPGEPTFAVVPGPFYNPNQGLGLMVIPLMLFHPSRDDTLSPPSIAALVGLYAVLPPLSDAGTRYSYALGAATRLYLDEDRWRLQGVLAYFDLFRQFRGIGGSTSSSPEFDYRQFGAVAFVQAAREVLLKHLYAGLLLGYVAFRTSTQEPANEAILESLGTGSEWSGQVNVGVVAQYDTKDNQYYPSSGLDFNLRLNGSPFSDQQYLVLVPSLNQYFALADGKRLVLAYRLFAQLGFGDLPLASYANYGSRGTTLGYATGDYVDKMMAGAEVELRWLFWWRLGAEGGVGLGKVFPSFDEFGPQPWLPGAWASLTYQVIEHQDLRARLTGAVSKAGGALYFAVGQNF
jgi:hypothetical protein